MKEKSKKTNSEKEPEKSAQEEMKEIADGVIDLRSFVTGLQMRFHKARLIKDVDKKDLGRLRSKIMDLESEVEDFIFAVEYHAKESGCPLP